MTSRLGNSLTKEQIHCYRKSPVQVFKKFCQDPDGKLLRDHDHKLFIIPDFSWQPGDYDIQKIFDVLSITRMPKEAILRVCNSTAHEEEYAVAILWIQMGEYS